MRNRPLASPLPSIKKKNDFKRAYGRGISAANPLFAVYAAANELNINRLGLSVSKKVGGAVVRNRVKRLIREACRHIFSQVAGQNIGQAFDLIVIARPPAAALPRETALEQTRAALTQLFTRLGVIQAPTKG